MQHDRRAVAERMRHRDRPVGPLHALADVEALERRRRQCEPGNPAEWSCTKPGSVSLTEASAPPGRVACSSTVGGTTFCRCMNRSRRRSNPMVRATVLSDYNAGRVALARRPGPRSVSPEPEFLVQPAPQRREPSRTKRARFCLDVPVLLVGVAAATRPQCCNAREAVAIVCGRPCRSGCWDVWR
jgi:hypothetical protein